LLFLSRQPKTAGLDWMGVRLFVGNLPYSATETALREHFSAIGPLSYIRVSRAALHLWNSASERKPKRRSASLTISFSWEGLLQSTKLASAKIGRRVRLPDHMLRTVSSPSRRVAPSVLPAEALDRTRRLVELSASPEAKAARETARRSSRYANDPEGASSARMPTRAPRTISAATISLAESTTRAILKVTIPPTALKTRTTNRMALVDTVHRNRN